MIKKQFSLVIGRSKWLLIYLATIHSLMLAMIIALSSSVWLSALAIILLSASFIYYCCCYQWLKYHRAINEIGRDMKGRWNLFYSDKSSQEKRVLKHCVVTSKLIILYFSGSSYWNTKSVFILEGAVDAELFRQLRVYCRDPNIFLQ